MKASLVYFAKMIIVRDNEMALDLFKPWEHFVCYTSYDIKRLAGTVYTQPT